MFRVGQKPRKTFDTEVMRKQRKEKRKGEFS